jgi:hypothetical protein
MEHESFENPAIAALLNEHFVSVKVDREERPDIDQIYMNAVQAISDRESPSTAERIGPLSSARGCRGSTTY